MDAIVAKKMRTEIRIGAVIIVLSIALLLSITFIAHLSSGLNEKIIIAEKQNNQYRKTIGEDVDALIKAQESRKYNLEQYYNQLKKSLNKSSLKSVSNSSPLSFKKILFDVQERLASKAKHNNVSLPQDLGFEDYRLKLPDAAQVPVLTRELLFSEQIIGLLIKNQMHSLKSIELPHKVESIDKKAKSAAGVSFETLSMQLSIETEFKQLKSFLLDLAASDKTYVIGKVNIKRADETNDRLLADITLKSLEL